MTSILDLVSWASLLAGGFFCIVGGLGLVRMPDAFTRMHAASVIDTLGAGFILLGLMLQAGWTLVSVKLFFMGTLLLFGSPSGTHALVKSAMIRGLRPLLAKDQNHG